MSAVNLKRITRRELIQYLGSAAAATSSVQSGWSASQSAVQFRDIARSAGITFTHDNAATPEKFLIETMGSGCGWIDYDQNGLLDLYLVNGAATRVYSPKGPLRSTLYRNNGDGTFRDASLEAGLGINRKYLGFGAGFFDYDNDGWLDIFLANGHVYAQIAGRGLYLSYKQPRLLYQNLRNGRFKDVSADAGPGIQATAVGRGCAFGDVDLLRAQVDLPYAADAQAGRGSLPRIAQGTQVSVHQPIAAIEQRQELLPEARQEILNLQPVHLVAVFLAQLRAGSLFPEELRFDMRGEIADPTVDAKLMVVGQ